MHQIIKPAREEAEQGCSHPAAANGHGYNLFLRQFSYPVRVKMHITKKTKQKKMHITCDTPFLLLVHVVREILAGGPCVYVHTGVG